MTSIDILLQQAASLFCSAVCGWVFEVTVTISRVVFARIIDNHSLATSVAEIRTPPAETRHFRCQYTNKIFVKYPELERKKANKQIKTLTMAKKIKKISISCHKNSVR